MTEFLNNLSLLANSVFDTLTSVFNLYTSTAVLLSVLGLLVLRRIMKLFHLL